MRGCRGLVLGAVSVILSPYIPRWMGSDPAIWADASRYFFIISIPMVFRAFSNVLGAALRAVQNTRKPMVINVAANGLNIVLNYLTDLYLRPGCGGSGHRLGGFLCDGRAC